MDHDYAMSDGQMSSCRGQLATPLMQLGDGQLAPTNANSGPLMPPPGFEDAPIQPPVLVSATVGHDLTQVAPPNANSGDFLPPPGFEDAPIHPPGLVDGMHESPANFTPNGAVGSDLADGDHPNGNPPPPHLSNVLPNNISIAAQHGLVMPPPGLESSSIRPPGLTNGIQGAPANFEPKGFLALGGDLGVWCPPNGPPPQVFLWQLARTEQGLNYVRGQIAQHSNYLGMNHQPDSSVGYYGRLHSNDSSGQRALVEMRNLEMGEARTLRTRPASCHPSTDPQLSPTHQVQQYDQNGRTDEHAYRDDEIAPINEDPADHNSTLNDGHEHEVDDNHSLSSSQYSRPSPRYSPSTPPPGSPMPAYQRFSTNSRPSSPPRSSAQYVDGNREESPYEPTSPNHSPVSPTNQPSSANYRRTHSPRRDSRYEDDDYEPTSPTYSSDSGPTSPIYHDYDLHEVGTLSNDPASPTSPNYSPVSPDPESSSPPRMDEYRQPVHQRHRHNDSHNNGDIRHSQPTRTCDVAVECDLPRPRPGQASMQICVHPTISYDPRTSFFKNVPKTSELPNFPYPIDKEDREKLEKEMASKAREAPGLKDSLDKAIKEKKKEIDKLDIKMGSRFTAALDEEQQRRMGCEMHEFMSGKRLRPPSPPPKLGERRQPLPVQNGAELNGEENSPDVESLQPQEVASQQYLPPPPISLLTGRPPSLPHPPPPPPNLEEILGDMIMEENDSPPRELTEQEKEDERLAKEESERHQQEVDFQRRRLALSIKELSPTLQEFAAVIPELKRRRYPDDKEPDEFLDWHEKISWAVLWEDKKDPVYSERHVEMLRANFKYHEGLIRNYQQKLEDRKKAKENPTSTSPPTQKAPHDCVDSLSVSTTPVDCSQEGASVREEMEITSERRRRRAERKIEAERKKEMASARWERRKGIARMKSKGRHIRKRIRNIRKVTQCVLPARSSRNVRVDSDSEEPISAYSDTSSDEESAPIESDQDPSAVLSSAETAAHNTIHHHENVADGEKGMIDIVDGDLSTIEDAAGEMGPPSPLVIGDVDSTETRDQDSRPLEDLSSTTPDEENLEAATQQQRVDAVEALDDPMGGGAAERPPSPVPHVENDVVDAVDQLAEEPVHGTEQAEQEVYSSTPLRRSKRARKLDDPPARSKAEPASKRVRACVEAKRNEEDKKKETKEEMKKTEVKAVLKATEKKTTGAKKGKDDKGEAEKESADVKLPFACTGCDKSFRFPCKLKQHMATHIAVKSFECKECHERFNQKYNLTAHMIRAHHPDINVRRPHKCEVCEKRFPDRNKLEIHADVHLPEDDPRKRKKIPCDFCEVSVKTKQALDRHMALKHPEESEKQ